MTEAESNTDGDANGAHAADVVTYPTKYRLAPALSQQVPTTRLDNRLHLNINSPLML